MTGDKGCDVIFECTRKKIEYGEYMWEDDRVITRPIKVAVQCKYRTTTDASKDVISETRAGQKLNGCNEGMCIVTTRYRPDAIQLAKKEHITYYDGVDFYENVLKKARRKGFKY